MASHMWVRKPTEYHGNDCNDILRYILELDTNLPPTADHALAFVGYCMERRAQDTGSLRTRSLYQRTSTKWGIMKGKNTQNYISVPIRNANFILSAFHTSWWRELAGLAPETPIEIVCDKLRDDGNLLAADVLKALLDART